MCCKKENSINIWEGCKNPVSKEMSFRKGVWIQSPMRKPSISKIKFINDSFISMYDQDGNFVVDNMNNPVSKIVTIHLGNGCSMTAVKDGKSIDHSLGFGPMNGLIMGTRSGDIDQSVIFYLVNTLKFPLDKVNTILQKKSGMKGLTGYSDLRDIEAQAAQGNTDCLLALAMNAYRIKKYIGAYTAVLNGLDAIVFTAGIGENSSLIRKLVCTDMNYLGIEMDFKKNETRSKALREINEPSSKTKILVVPTDEEMEIAKQVYNFIGSV
jgi:acetate kinase